MGDVTVPGYSEVGGGENDACVDEAETMDDNGSEGAEGEVDIIAKEKQTNADSKIYYAIHTSKNKTSTTPDKTNKTPILISN